MRKLPTEKQLRAIEKNYDLPLVRVVWRDSTSYGGWNKLEYYRGRECHEIASIGYLIMNTEKQVILAQSVCKDGDVNDIIAIPKPWIGSFSFLKERR